jgi:CubicO group peptidase (beta-lactamase class C family)
LAGPARRADRGALGSRRRAGHLFRGAVIDVTAGLLSTRTLVDATPDSLFQIGSITKVWTATLVMRLVDEGRIELDTRVADVLDDCALPDAEVARRVTIRHLLSHTSGLDGDYYVDTGPGDDALRRYVDSLRNSGQTHPPGAMFSYCNSGYLLAARIAEVLTGTDWDSAMRRWLIEPLGLTATVTRAEDAVLHRVAAVT